MIKTYNYNITQAECGVLVNFNPVFSSFVDGLGIPANSLPNLPAKETYILSFSVENTIPSGKATITLSPITYTIANSKAFIPQVSAKINTQFNGESQSLIKLVIKDIYNNHLYSDYVNIVCSPNSTIQRNGTYNTINKGPTNGTIINVESSDLLIGMTVKDIGSGASSNTFSIIKIISSGSIEILDNTLPSTLPAGSRTFEFTRNIGCIAPDNNSGNISYIYLNQSNNWTYKVNDKIIAKFNRANNNDNVTIVLQAKNASKLPDKGSKQDIPSVSIVRVNGPVALIS
jgi:hypothetical protein